MASAKVAPAQVAGFNPSPTREETDGEPTTLIDLLEDLLSLIIGRLGLPSSAHAAAACSTLRTAATSEVAAEMMAREIYGALVDRSAYPSWLALLRDDNAAGGAWCLPVRVQSDWRFNMPTRYYTNRLAALWYEPGERAPDGTRSGAVLHALIDAYGEADLRPTHSSVLLLEPKAAQESRSLHDHRRGPPITIFRASNYTYHTREPGHHLCSLFFDAAKLERAGWAPGATLHFNFNGCNNMQGTDYPVVRVLTVPEDATTLARHFTSGSVHRGGPAGGPHGVVTRRFDLPLAKRTIAPADPASLTSGEWLPSDVARRFENREWGN